MSTFPSLIYKIEGAAIWHAAISEGRYLGSADDLRDGFIHLSTATQATATAAKYFAGRNDLVLAAIACDRLGPALRWEASRGGALFPHLYSPLAATAIVWTKPLVLGPDSQHDFPMEMV